MKKVEVAAAVILRADGAFLLGQRPTDTPYADYWEFPGGKLEAGESARHALDRELKEELGIQVTCAYPWITREFHYPHAHVRLYFFRVVAWDGQIDDIQHTALAWQHCDNLTVAPMLPANAPILRALALPDFYAITHAGTIGIAAQLTALDRALHAGLQLVQIREPLLDRATMKAFSHEVIQRAKAYGAKVLINGNIELAEQLNADGIHLSAGMLMQIHDRPNFEFVAASCHNQEELARAANLACDFAVLGPVQDTPSHPDTQAMGWQHFAKMTSHISIPVYALGGLTRQDLEEAYQAGAHGIGAIRAAWNSL